MTLKNFWWESIFDVFESLYFQLDSSHGLDKGGGSSQIHIHLINFPALDELSDEYNIRCSNATVPGKIFFHLITPFK